jgi:hypothetical protein
VTISLDDYQNLVKKVDELKAAKERAKGALDALLDRMKREWGCASAEEAGKLLKKFEREERLAYEQYVEAKKRFLAEWGVTLKES